MKSTTASAIATLAFVAGFAASRWAPPAQAQTTAPAPLTAQIIDVNALDGDSISAIAPNTEMRSKLLVNTSNATIAVQQGNVGKHYHASSDEIQFILSGTGTIWLGDVQREVKPGDLVIIPKNVNHAGAVKMSGAIKALAIKIPPQVAGDVHFVN
jgi:mannose-6-phosphate isomerase-like protein (cupin superfamily)